MQQHALTEGLLVAMEEEWAAKQPAALPDALEAVEALLLHPRRDRKSLSYTGGIRVSGLDFGYPCLTKDGCRVMTRDPGDDLWAQTFDWLAPEPSLAHLNADTKGDFLELTLAAAAQVLGCAEKPCSEPLMRCLHAARLLIGGAARTLEGLQLRGNPLLLRVTREVDGCSVSCKSCPKCGGAVFGQWRYATWGGLLAAVGAHAC